MTDYSNWHIEGGATLMQHEAVLAAEGLPFGENTAWADKHSHPLRAVVCSQFGSENLHLVQPYQGSPGYLKYLVERLVGAGGLQYEAALREVLCRPYEITSKGADLEWLLVRFE